MLDIVCHYLHTEIVGMAAWHISDAACTIVLWTIRACTRFQI